jgi:hypothetical protein
MVKSSRNAFSAGIAFALGFSTIVTFIPGIASGQTDTPPNASASTAAAPSSSASPAAVLAAFTTAWSGTTGYNATVTVMERKGTDTQKVVFNYSFRKPTDVTVHVAAGPNAGATMVWSGGDTVIAHRGSGFAALFKKTIPLHDPQVTTIRGSSVDQLSFGAILAHAQDQAGKLTDAPPGTADGQPTDAITLMSADPATDAGLTREVVELSTQTHLPVQVLGYQGATLVRQIDFTNVTKN